MKAPIFETMINTTALALTSYGVLEVTSKGNLYGLISIAFGMGLEFLKYYYRKV